MIEAADQDLIERVLKVLSPLSRLNHMSASVTRYAAQNQSLPKSIWGSFELASARGIGATTDEIRNMKLKASARRMLLESNTIFRRSLERLTLIGYAAEWASDGEYGISLEVFRLIASPKIIPLLHEMAADDAGVFDLKERKKLIELHEKWVLQYYHPDYEIYRKRWPHLDNPYNTPMNDFGRSPNPLCRLSVKC